MFSARGVGIRDEASACNVLAGPGDLVSGNKLSYRYAKTRILIWSMVLRTYNTMK